MPVRSEFGILTSIPIAHSYAYSYALSNACGITFRDLDLCCYSLFLCLFLCLSLPISNACGVAFQILPSIPKAYSNAYSSASLCPYHMPVGLLSGILTFIPIAYSCAKMPISNACGRRLPGS